VNINQGPLNLFDLFQRYGKVSVPEFQRNYSWTKIQVDQFLDDIFESANSSEPHFWGPILVLHDAKAREAKVIDGQQRISTAMIVLSILRDEATNLKQPYINVGLPSQFDVRPTIRNFLFGPPTWAEPRFQSNYLIGDIFKERIIADPQTPNPGGGDPTPRPPISPKGGGMTPRERQNSKELRAAHIRIGERVKAQLRDLLTEEQKTSWLYRVFQSLTSEFQFYTLELSDEGDAFELFESLNARGLELRPADILKTITLRDFLDGRSPIPYEDALDMWDRAVDTIAGCDFTKFLRHYLLTKTDRKVQTKKIVGEFRTQIEALGQDGYYKNLKNIESAAIDYAFLIGEVDHPNQALRDCFGRVGIYSETHRVFMLGLLGLKLDVKLAAHLARSVEFLSYRWIACGNNAQELESIYQKQIRVLQDDPTELGASRVADEFVKIAPSDVSFADDLIRSDSPDLRRYLLYRIATSGGGYVPLSANLEHLAPVQPGRNSDYWYKYVADKNVADEFNSTYEDYVNSWGNMTLLEEVINKSVKNSEWSVKVSGIGKTKGISASTNSLNQEIKSLPFWTASHIRSREGWLKSCATSLVSADWVLSGAASVGGWQP
jgi:hypothetical protein